MTGFAGTTVVFRTDASLQIGTGHVMRCLTLAAALKASGARCRFVCRAHAGHLIEQIARQGHQVVALPQGTSTPGPEANAHSAWLGSDWATDAQQTLVALEGLRPDWLVIDHYAIDAPWESLLHTQAVRLLVIDDLADRPHRCELLLDQNLGRQASDYARWVPPGCPVLAGPRFALLRPEFAELRAQSLHHRSARELRCVLVAMGGVDQPNATGAVLAALRDCELPAQSRIVVVMGTTAPWLDEVRALAARMPWPTDVRVGVDSMARVMADADLAIGAAGGTAWERCCLGLPSLLVVLADNQAQGARALESHGAAILLGDKDAIASRLPGVFDRLAKAPELARLAGAAAAVSDGAGVERVLNEMGALHA